MASFNRVILLGNLGQDPEIRETPQGFAVGSVSLATNEVRTDREGKKQDLTEWHRLVFLGKTAETARKYLKKGSTIFVEGRLQTRSWEDKQGQKRYTTEIVVDRFQFASPPQTQSRSPNAPGAYGSSYNETPRDYGQPNAGTPTSGGASDSYFGQGSSLSDPLGGRGGSSFGDDNFSPDKIPF